MSILTVGVGAGNDFATIGDAVRASKDGDTVQVQAGTYVDDFATINTKITIQAVGGWAHLLAINPPPDGKAIFTVNANVTMDHLEFSGAAVADANGAGIRYQNGDLVLTNCWFHDNENGILGGPSVAGTGSITISNSEFSYNGNGNGLTHNLYVGEVGSLTVDNSYFHDAVVGHEFKSRAFQTTITNSRFQDGPTGTASYSIDLPNGGNALIKGNSIQQGPASQNPAIIAFGEEGNLHPGSALIVTNNQILNDLSAPTVAAVWNATYFPASLTNNSVYGLTTPQLTRGAVTVSGVTVLATEPALDTSQPWTGPSPTAQPQLPPSADKLVLQVSEDAYQGDAQFALSIDGKVLAAAQTVTALHGAGATQTFTYTGNFGVGSHVVSLSFLNDAWGGGPSLDRNLFLDGLTFDGTAATIANGGFIASKWGALVVTPASYATTVATPVTTPTATPVATPAPTPAATMPAATPVAADTLVVSLSEDAYQGDAQFTVSVDGKALGAAQSVTALHGAKASQAFSFAGNFGAGAHKVSVSFLNDAWGGTAATDRNLYVDGVTLNGAAVPGASGHLFSNGTLDFTATAPAAATPVATPVAADTLVVSLSEDAYQGDAQFTVSVDGKALGAAQSVTALHGAKASQAFSFSGNFGAGPHKVSVSFLNDAWGGTAATDRNLYVDGVTLNGAAAPGASGHLFSNGTLDFTATAPAASTTATASATVQISTSTLALHLSEDAYQGDAQFIATLDGTPLGAAQSVTALHGAGAVQDFSFSGIAAGAHDLAISFLNDAWGGTAGTDRNLYVNGVDLNGAALPGSAAALFSNGAAHFTFVAPATV